MVRVFAPMMSAMLSFFSRLWETMIGVLVVPASSGCGFWGDLDPFPAEGRLTTRRTGSVNEDGVKLFLFAFSVVVVSVVVFVFWVDLVFFVVFVAWAGLGFNFGFALWAMSTLLQIDQFSTFLGGKRTAHSYTLAERKSTENHCEL
jgi:hypothetical protein